MSDLSALQDAQTALAELGPLPFPLPLGALAPVVVGGFTGMAKADWVVAGPRERIGAVLRGCPVARLTDPAAGARPYKLAPVSSAPGARALHAVGLALGSERPVLCFVGLASAASGAFAEALNVAAMTGASVIFLATTPTLTDDAPVGRQLAGNLSDIAAAHGLPVDELALTGDADHDAEQVRAAVAARRELAAPCLVHIRLS